MKKKILSIITTLTMLTMLLPCIAHAEIIDSGECGAQGDNVIWTLDDAGTLTISGEGDMADQNISTSVMSSQIKKVIIEGGITKIGDNSFRNYTGMTEITIPDGITSIGEEAFFNCMRLKDLTIPDSVATIEKHAFIGCEALTDVKLPAELKRIEIGIFAVCSSLKTIKIPESVLYIGSSAFSSCKSLTEAVLPEKVTSLSESIFEGCENLKTLRIQGRLYHISSNAFNGCSNLTDVYYNWVESQWKKVVIDYGNNNLLSANIHCINSGKMGENIIWTLEGDTLTLSGNGDTYDYENTYGGNCSPFNSDSDLIKNIYVQDGITGIGDNAFYNYHALENVTLPDSLTRIGSGAFSRCQSVKDFILSEKITEIADNAFDGFINAPVLHVVQGSYAENYAKEHAQLYEVPGNSPIMVGKCGDNVSFEYRDDNQTLTILGTGMLYQYNHSSEFGSNAPWHGLYSRVKKVIIEEGIENTSSNAFTYFDAEEIKLPSTLLSIDNNAFFYSGFSHIIIPDNVTKIGTGAFGKTNLNYIWIPKNVKEIESYVLSILGINNKTVDIYYSGNKEDWEKIAIGNNNDTLLSSAFHYNSIGTSPPKIVDMPTVTYEENGYTINISLDSVEYDSQIIAVTYDNGQATGFGTDTLSAGDAEKSITVPADVSDSIKVFIWDSLNGMKPLCPAVEVPIQ